MSRPRTMPQATRKMAYFTFNIRVFIPEVKETHTFRLYSQITFTKAPENRHSAICSLNIVVPSRHIQTVITFAILKFCAFKTMKLTAFFLNIIIKYILITFPRAEPSLHNYPNVFICHRCRFCKVISNRRKGVI